MPPRSTRRRAAALLALASLLLAALAALPSASAASLLAVDYGTDSFKASLVKPGVPFDVLLTKEGRRKTPAIVTYRGDDRFVGGDAQSLATRFPQDTLPSVKLLLAHSPAHPQAQLHASLFDLPQTTTARSSPAVTLGTGSKRTSVPVEEALAFQFVYAKELAEESANEAVRDTVVTVPGWFAEKERRAVMDAAEIAGLRVVGLVNDGAAAAVNYAMGRSFSTTPAHHLIYDLGSGSLTVSLVSLKSALLPDPTSLSETPQLKNVTALTVHGFAYDVEVSGFVFDRIVRDLLVEAFDATLGKQLEGGKKLTDDKRAMAKLLKEATRVKQVLSANTAASARIEGLIDDLDFRTEITRAALEERAAWLLPRLSVPVTSALASASLSLSDIESVILVGGSSRVPLVQAAIAEAVGADKIAKNVNADEAAVLGAALYGASSVPGFRTKDIRLVDVTPFAVDVAYEAEKGTSESDPRIITTHLFPAFTKLPTRKTLTLRRTTDFTLDLSYPPSSLPSAPQGHLASVRLSGVSSACANLTAEQAANATVLVPLELNADGLLKVGKAVLVLREEDADVKEEKGVADRLKGLFARFGAKNATSSEGATEGEEEKEPLNEEEKAELERLVAQSQLPPARVALDVEVVQPEEGGKSMSKEELVEAKKRLRDAKSALQRKLAREEARNVLEAYVYKVRDLLDGGSAHGAAFLAASVDAEREKVRELQSATAEWLWDEGESAETKVLKEKKRDLEKLVKHILSRSTEALARPAALASLHSTLTSASAFLADARKNATAAAAADADAPARFTPDELDKLDALLKETRAWVEDADARQAKLRAHEDPVVRVAEVEKKEKEVEREVAKLEKKKVPRRRKAGTKAETVKPEPTAAKGDKEHKKDEL
ncbi:lumenal Hsp70 protein [Rhodotorula kratochvilovae]